MSEKNPLTQQEHGHDRRRTEDGRGSERARDRCHHGAGEIGGGSGQRRYGAGWPAPGPPGTRRSTRLHGALAAGAADRGEARIVAVSSRASLDAPVDFDDINFERRPYDPGIAYGQSKTANVLFAVEATRRWHADGVVANAVNPGGVATNLQRHLPDEAREAMHAADQKSIGQGAATTLVAAIAPEFAHVGGRYLENGTEAEIVDDSAPPVAGVRRWALDPAFAERLWTVSSVMVGTH